jgi:tetratricopeptide (TPR) repeat protein
VNEFHCPSGAKPRVAARRTAAAVVAAALLLWASPPPASAGDRRGIDEIRALLAAGKPADALARAKLALAAVGDDPDVLELASDAASAATSPDEALWFAHVARSAAMRRGAEDRAKALSAKADKLEPPDLGERAPIDAVADAQLAAARLCSGKRFFVNAVQLLSRLESTPIGARAEADLDRIYANKQAVASLSDSKIALPRTQSGRKARAKAARDDAKHATWETARKFETPNYTVLTDAGFEVGQSVATAMEPMNRYYRRVFHYMDKPKEMNTPIQRCTIRVYKSKAEMDAIGKGPVNAVAYYDPNDNSVSAYDPRSEGRPMSSMWPTLFHEASHQFTDMITGQRVPSWLNEGTASYFEGAVLRADGRVDVNLVPMYRLKACVESLRTGSPRIKDVLSYGDASYPGECYPIGWALVYFLRNYEDDKLQRVYEKYYSALLDSYRGPGVAVGPLDRFTKFLIDLPKEPDVPDFDAFVRRFRTWIAALDHFEGGPPSVAREFVERAKKHADLGRKDDAEDDLRKALDKNPGFVPALEALGGLLASAGRRDEAVSCFRRAAEAARGDPAAAGLEPADASSAEQRAKAAIASAAKVDAEVGQAFLTMDGELAAKAVAQAEKYVAAKMPRNALRVLDAAGALLAGRAEVENMRRAVAQESGVDVLLTRQLDLRPGADRVWSTDGWTVDGAKLAAPKARASVMLFDAGLGERYRFEATVRPKEMRGEDAFAGLVVGADAEGEWKVVGLSGDTIDVWNVCIGWTQAAAVGQLTSAQRASFRLAVEVRPRFLRVFVDGEAVAEQEYPAGALRGGVGLIATEAAAEFEDARLAY